MPIFLTALANVLENTALFGDILLRLPDITHEVKQRIRLYFKVLKALYISLKGVYSRLSLNGHLCKIDTSVKWTPSVGPFLSFLPLFDSL